MSQSTNIMGIPFPNVTMDQTVAILDKVVDQESNELFHVITGNPEMVMSCQKNASLRNVVDQAGLVTADGAGIVMVSRFRGGQLTERVTGCDLLFRLLEEGDQKHWSFYMLGAEESVSEQAVKIIAQRYPGVIVKVDTMVISRQMRNNRLWKRFVLLNQTFLSWLLAHPMRNTGLTSIATS